MKTTNITTSIIKNNNIANDELKTVRIILNSLSNEDLSKFMNELNDYVEQYKGVCPKCGSQNVIWTCYCNLCQQAY